MNIDLQKYPLDQEMQDYLRKSESMYPANASKLSYVESRRLYLEMAQAFTTPVPETIDVSDATVVGRHGAVPIRTYRPTTIVDDTLVIYLHGGGFVLGNLDSHHSVCAELAERTRRTVIAVDYRLSPEHVHPVALEDCLDVFIELDRGKTILCGDSAGGTLVGSMCVHQLDKPNRAIGQLLIYPWLGGELFDLDSYRDNDDAPGLTVTDLQDFRDLRSNGAPACSDPIYYPLAASDFSGLPPCIATTAEFDPLRDDALLYVDKLQQAGVKAKCYLEKGLIHGYLRARHMSTKAAQSFDRICNGIQSLANTAS